MSPQRRGPETYELPDDGPAVVVPGWAAARLHRVLARLHDEVGRTDPDLDAVLVALLMAAGRWHATRTAAPASSGNGTPAAAASGTTVDTPTTTPAPSSQIASAPRLQLTSAQAAAHLGLTDRAVRGAAARGSLPATRIGRTWTFTPADLETYRQEHDR